jgi:uncharacterized membrane protein YdjX (TVP38/TMEM64 family)
MSGLPSNTGEMGLNWGGCVTECRYETNTQPIRLGSHPVSKGAPIGYDRAIHLLIKVTPLALVVILSVIVMATGLHRELSVATLIRHRAAVNGFVAGHPVTAFVSFIALYVGVVALSIPGALVLTVSSGLLFGALVGASGAFIGAILGASLIFLIARSALGGWLVKRAGPFAEKLAAGFRRGAFSYLLFLRLVPLFPFWLVNIAPALFGVRFSVFIGATALGIIPLTVAYALFGAGLDSAIAAQASAYEACLAAAREQCQIDFDLRLALTPQLIAALAAITLVALTPLIVRRWRARREAMTNDADRP